MHFFHQAVAFLFMELRPRPHVNSFLCFLWLFIHTPFKFPKKQRFCKPPSSVVVQCCVERGKFLTLRVWLSCLLDAKVDVDIVLILTSLTGLLPCAYIEIQSLLRYTEEQGHPNVRWRSLPYPAIPPHHTTSAHHSTKYCVKLCGTVESAFTSVASKV